MWFGIPMCFYGVANFLFVRELVCILQILVFIIISFQQRGKFSIQTFIYYLLQKQLLNLNLQRDVWWKVRRREKRLSDVHTRQSNGGNGLKERERFQGEKQFSFLPCLSFVKFKFVQFKLIPFCHLLCEIWGKYFYWISKDFQFIWTISTIRRSLRSMCLSLRFVEKEKHMSSSSVGMEKEGKQCTSIERVKSNICLEFMKQIHLDFVENGK